MEPSLPKQISWFYGELISSQPIKRSKSEVKQIHCRAVYYDVLQQAFANTVCCFQNVRIYFSAYVTALVGVCFFSVKSSFSLPSIRDKTLSEVSCKTKQITFKTWTVECNKIFLLLACQASLTVQTHFTKRQVCFS